MATGTSRHAIARDYHFIAKELGKDTVIIKRHIRDTTDLRRQIALKRLLDITESWKEILEQ